MSISLCYWIIIGSGGQWLCFIYFSEKESTQQEKGLLSAVLACKCVWFFIFIFCIGVCCVALSFFDAWLWRIGFIQFFVLLNIGQALTYLQYCENFPNFGRDMDFQIHEAQRSPNSWTRKGLKHIVINLPKVKDKKKEKSNLSNKGTPLTYQQISQWKIFKPREIENIYSKYWKKKCQPTVL